MEVEHSPQLGDAIESILKLFLEGICR